VYREKMLARYGQDTIDRLYYLAKQPRKFATEELREMCKRWNEAAYYIEENERLPGEVAWLEDFNWDV